MENEERQRMCDLDEAFDRARSVLPPDDWKFVGFVQDATGWRVSAARVGWTPAGDTWYPRIDARAGTLTKALNRLADKLEEHANRT